MKFVLAAYGMRGDVDPCVVVGRELARRGHDAQMAVPPNLVEFAEAAGLPAVAYGLDSQAVLDAQRNYWTSLLRTPWKTRELKQSGREIGEHTAQCWQQMTTTLAGLADGADLVVSGPLFESPAANVAEYYDIPLASLHYIPLRPNGRLLPFVPPVVSRTVMTANDWLSWRTMRKVEDAQRRELGLSDANAPAPRRIAERGSLEIQAYDEVCFPGLAAEWAKFDGRRPFVGALTMEAPADVDDGKVEAWVADGTPPIYFGFGSITVGSAADTLAMIAAACARLGERALVNAGGTDFGDASRFEHVKVVGSAKYATIFPACRAVVHHGGGGTTNESLRAGVPTLILWTLPDQPLWGATVKRLKVGTSRRFSSTTEKSLVADLRRILAPRYRTRAREVATRMTPPAESVTRAADLVEEFASRKHAG